MKKALLALLLFITFPLLAAGPYYKNEKKYSVEVATAGGVSVQVPPGKYVEGEFFAPYVTKGILVLYVGTPASKDIVYSFPNPEGFPGINGLLPSQADANGKILSSNSGSASWIKNGAEVVGTTIVLGDENTTEVKAGTDKQAKISGESLALTSGDSKAIIGAELLTNPLFTTDLTGWTAGTGWAWATGGALHTAGNTDALSQAIAGIVSGNVYQVLPVISGRTAGSITVTLGTATLYVDGTTLTSTDYIGFPAIMAPSSGTLTLSITPTTDFNGKIDSVSVKPISASTSNVPITIAQPNGNVLELRGHVNTSDYQYFADYPGSLFIGANAGRYCTGFDYYASNNTVLGQQAGANLVAGADNTIIGSHAGRNVVNSSANVFIGNNAGGGVHGGSYNIAIGHWAMPGYNDAATVIVGRHNVALGARTFGTTNYTGSFNVALGNFALESSTSGSSNAGVGFDALGKLTTGEYNVGVGREAGYKSGATPGTANALTTGSNNTFLGSQAGFGSATQRTNATAIGYQAYVDADNTVVLGDENVTDVLIGSAKQAKISAKGIKLTTGAKPTCDATTDLTIWGVAGGAGVADTLEVCRKDAANAYAWVTLF